MSDTIRIMTWRPHYIVVSLCLALTYPFSQVLNKPISESQALPPDLLLKAATQIEETQPYFNTLPLFHVTVSWKESNRGQPWDPAN